MSQLHDILDPHVRAGNLPGAVALVATGDDAEVTVAGRRGIDGVPMTRETIFRISSMTKPITAAAVMLLVDQGVFALDDPVAPWLPELASPRVLRTPSSPIDDVVPADRPITVHDLLTSRGGHGLPSDFTLPVVGLLVGELGQGPPAPQQVAAPDEWMTALSTIPLLHHPGEGWLYNTSSDIQGVLVARTTGRPFDEFLAERVFGPLGMVDTGFHVPADKVDRFAEYYRTDPDHGLSVADRRDGEWSSPPAFPSGAGGLVSTVDDWWAFARMLLAGGTVGDRALLSGTSVELMMTDHLTEAQRASARLFLGGQGWGFGGSVDLEATDSWNVPGRYGWVGGTGTAAHVIPASHTTTVLLTQVGMTDPAPPALMREFWAHAATMA